MRKPSPPRVIFVQESLRVSILRDITTFATIAGLWSLGYFTGSSALEWVGAIIGLIVIVAKASRWMSSIQERGVMTAAQARAWLDENFPE